MYQFHLNMNIEGRVCRHSVTSSETSSAWEIFFMHDLHMVFPFMMSNWSYTEQVKKFVKWQNFQVGRTFSSKVSSEGSYLNWIAKSTPEFWAFDRRSSSKIDGSYGNLKIWPIFLPGDLVPWPTYLSMSHTGTADPFHMWTKFGDDMSKRSWVMLDKTDRLTDRQTDKRTYLPKTFGK